MRILKRHKIYAILIVMALNLLHSAPLFAKISLSDVKAEEIAIAYYKTGGVIPNFERWIKDRAPYNLTPWAMREKIYDQELERLQTAYVNFKPNVNFITVQTKCIIEVSEDVDKDNKPVYYFNSRFVEAPEALYFPYDFLDDRIAVMPYYLQDIMHMPISKEEYDRIGPIARKHKIAKAVIRMRPFEADFSKPYKMDGLEQWVFKTKISNFEMWDSDKQLIWEYKNQNYISENEKEIKKLFDDRPENSFYKKGSIKPTNNQF